jgi:hypothetical protein
MTHKFCFLLRGAKLFHISLLIMSPLVLLLTGCSRVPAETVPGASSIPPTAAAIAPTTTPVSRAAVVPPATPTATPLPQGGSLRIISPLESTELSGGADLRIALYLVDHDDLPVEGATAQAELWLPSGELFTSLPCIDKRQGRYLAEYVRLPLRGAGGTWHIVGRAIWKDGQQAEAERTFQASPSPSEMYQKRYGFWIEPPRVFASGTGFYNLQGGGGLHFEDWLNEDGSGYVILDNYQYSVIGVTFATLELHWRQVDFPTDSAAAIAHVQSLAEKGLHHQDPEASLTGLTATTVTFQGRPAWQVLGWGEEYYVAKASAAYPVEWLIFRCPASDWLWSLVLSSDHVSYMKNLRALRKTFECPPAR